MFTYIRIHIWYIICALITDTLLDKLSLFLTFACAWQYVSSFVLYVFVSKCLFVFELIDNEIDNQNQNKRDYYLPLDSQQTDKNQIK